MQPSPFSPQPVDPQHTSSQTCESQTCESQVSEGQPSESEALSFEQSLLNLEQSVATLKARHTQVQTDRQQQTKLQGQCETYQAQQRQGNSPELQLELQRIQQELAALEIRLESQLFSWSGLKEVFWQAIRFGGLGILVGWSLACYTLKYPTPTPSVAPNPPSAPHS